MGPYHGLGLNLRSPLSPVGQTLLLNLCPTDGQTLEKVLEPGGRGTRGEDALGHGQDRVGG